MSRIGIVAAIFFLSLVLFCGIVLSVSVAHCSELYRYPIQAKELAETQARLTREHSAFKIVNGYVLTTKKLLEENTKIICVVMQIRTIFIEVHYFQYRGKIVDIRSDCPSLGEVKDLLRETT